ncbi:MAG TPA: serine/threonine-protein kinase [Polyangiaceae bacterium]|nr:serine/threonine-protein kinase [Polyangiaceae bacterium]
MAAEPNDSRFDEETRALLQHRLWTVFGMLSLLAFFYALSQFVQDLVAETERSRSVLLPLRTFLNGAGAGLVALRCRTGRRSVTELRLLDAFATAGTCWFIAASLTDVPPPNEASLSIVLGATYVLLARAIFLPSSGWRTLGVSLLALVPAGVIATRLRLEAYGAVDRPSEWPLQAFLVFRNLGVTAFLATFTSRVIYGLRRQVRDAARLGQYVLREKIGEGGMGAVYRATHALLRRDTAVKVLLPRRVGDHGMMRFEREVKLTAQLKHPSTVAIFDYGRTPDGVFYYAMEYLEGGDLEQLVEYRGPLPVARVVWVLEQVCRALAEAHGLGLIHRDVKPSNVLLCERGGEGDVAKMVDFGLVKDLRAGGDSAQTHDGALTGTPLYIAPESISAPDTIDARADLYSLGALAYFLLVGEPVFQGDNIVGVCAAHLHTPPPRASARRPEVGPELDAVLLRCLEKQPAARFASALALRAALLACPLDERWGAGEASAWWAEHRGPFGEFCASTRKARLGSSARSPGAAIVVDLREPRT